MVSGAVTSLPDVLARLKLVAMRDRLDSLLDEATRRDLTLPETLLLLCQAEVARREERRIQMGLGIASSRTYAPWKALTSPLNLRWIPSRSASSQPAGGSATATRC